MHPGRDRQSGRVRILFTASELAPYAKTGGLADVSTALVCHMHDAGHDIRPVLPMYAGIDPGAVGAVPVDYMQDVPLVVGTHHYHCSLFTAPLTDDGPMVYFVHCPALFWRGHLYTHDADEHLRFLALNHAAAGVCQHMGFSPQIVHVNDWQTAPLPLLLRASYAWDDLFADTKSVLSIHNIAYQGIFPSGIAPDVVSWEHTHLLHQDDLFQGRINFLKTGILYADAITTVSPTYAQEILTPEFGEGLDGVLHHREADFVGILNGVDYHDWDPRHDTLIPHAYSADDLSGKALNREALLETLALPHNPQGPVLGMVTRLAGQKGIELLHDTLPEVLRSHDIRVAVLGSGEYRYEEYFKWLQHTCPDQVCFYNGFSNELAHLIEAGADAFLMPSLYEPCGLNQMYSLRYGTVPVVRATGGLADTVQPFDETTGEGTGIVFEHFDVPAMRWALDRTLTLFQDKASWTRMMLNGMQVDFSWDRQGAMYERLYEHLASS